MGSPADVSSEDVTLTLGPGTVVRGAGEPAPGVAEGTILGRFVVRGTLGEGGMGRVLLARDPDLRRDVAIKVVRDPRVATPEQLARFVAEAQITGQLEHPNIVPIHDIGGTADGQVFIVMKKIEGSSLREVMDRLRKRETETLATWTRHRLLNAFVQVCNGIAYAHDRGVLHRDLKPDNIMLGPYGEVLVLDWGVARLLGGPAERQELVPLAASTESAPSVERLSLNATLEGTSVGTPGYMSPEQAGGQLGLLDARSDVWSLGAILYELLTGERAYHAESLIQLLFKLMSGPPQDPRERAPEARIDEEIARIAMRALSPSPDERPQDARALARDVEAFLEGSRKREEAARRVAEGRGVWEQFLGQQRERDELLASESAWSRRLDPWASLDEKRPVHLVRQRLEDLEPEHARTFAQVIALGERSLSQDPGHPAARALLADAHWHRFEEAERRADRRDQQYWADRVREFDDGDLAARLRGTGALTLRTDPPGAEVVCERVDRRGLVWPLLEQRVLGHTPLVAVPLEMGSYRLLLRAPGRREAVFPVLITRGLHWDAGAEPIPLLASADLGDDFVYVPRGPFVFGERREEQVHEEGFLIAVFPVTQGQWCEFLNALAARDPEGAWARVPRQGGGAQGAGGQYWERPGAGAAYVVPERDRDGDAWNPRWPVVAITWDDAMAYAAWRSEATGRPHALPSDRQWEKAARGVDGRIHPWGDRFDPALCKMQDSRPGRPAMEPVGAFPNDVSIYGVRDLAGATRDWCADADFDGDTTKRPVRGGAWLGSAEFCRATARAGVAPWIPHGGRGLRLVRPLNPS